LFFAVSIDCFLITMHALDARSKYRVLRDVYDENIECGGVYKAERIRK
jgi:hypothetical protein